MTQQLQILHLSDLHIDTSKNFDRSLVLDPLIERVKADQKKDIQPELVIVTGDIANKGIKKEYDEAKIFFADLLDEMKLSKERLFIVPGNHDVNRKKYRPKDIPAYDNMKELNDELENKEYRADLLKGMADYFDFIKNEYPHIKPLDENLIPFVTSYKAECKKQIGLVGLNSAWMCRKSPDEREIAIGEYQIKQAMKKVKGKNDLVICSFHHPLNWLWPEDKSRSKKYLDNKIILCGHLHDAEGGWYNEYDVSLHMFQAGAAYLNDEKWPERYQYLEYDWKSNQIRLLFRKYSKKTGKWTIDGETGDDGKKIFKLSETDNKNGESDIHKTLPDIPAKYLEWISANYGHVDADKLYGKGESFPLSLPEIFIPLYGNDPFNKIKVEKLRDIEKLRKKDMEENKPVSITTMIAQKDALLIEGQAGSGKTTLIKYLTYILSQKKIDNDIKPLSAYMPVLIYLKDLNQYFKENEKLPSKQTILKHILSWYIKTKIGKALNIKVVQQYLEAGRILFLLDGLDELSDEYREIIVNSFMDSQIENPGIKITISSRPHAINGVAVNRFDKKRVKILPLNWEQINEFIKKWFLYLYPGTSGTGDKNSQAMINAAKTHSGISELIENPLMLTAICILYHDGKELPNQRAELYKKFIDNLLYRRFDDPVDVHDFLKLLAFNIHTQKQRSFDRASAIEAMKEVFKKEKDEKVRDYNRRIEKIFDDIEPKCGLLKYENDQFMFWHLTFQEFLAADYIIDNFSNRLEAIEEYWKDEWYKEMIELYIGYLSIEQKKTANEIIESALDPEKENAPYRSCLAARSLLDIPENRRINSVVKKTKARLLGIIEETQEDTKILFEAGENFGWLGDTRNLEEFIPVKGGKYNLEGLGESNIRKFEIGKYPVTNRWFSKFIERDGYENKVYWSREGIKWLRERGETQPRFWNDHKWKCPNSPVVGICWYEADAFCRWLTITKNDGYTYRLPTEKEWQAAAAGKDGRVYPWGNDWNKDKCNNEEAGIGRTSPVGIFKDGATPENIFDLAGNVWEWTSTANHSGRKKGDFKLDTDWEKGPVVRGGSWSLDAEYCRCAIRFDYFPSNGDGLIGFRCART